MLSRVMHPAAIDLALGRSVLLSDERGSSTVRCCRWTTICRVAFPPSRRKVSPYAYEGRHGVTRAGLVSIGDVVYVPVEEIEPSGASGWSRKPWLSPSHFFEVTAEKTDASVGIEALAGTAEVTNHGCRSSSATPTKAERLSMELKPALKFTKAVDCSTTLMSMSRGRGEGVVGAHVHRAEAVQLLQAGAAGTSFTVEPAGGDDDFNDG